MRGHYGRLAAGGLLVLGLWTGWLVLGLPGQTISRAQEGEETATFTPTPDTGDIFGYREEVVFPAVIRFVIGMNLGVDNIEGITLTLQQQSGFGDIISLDLEKDLLESAGIVTQYLYVMDLTVGPGPVPFETVSFKWEVKTKEGKISTAENEFEFEDEAHGPWETAGEPPLVLYWLNEHLAGDSIRNEVLAAYGLLSQRTQLSPSFRFVIYDPNTALCQEKRDETTNERISLVISQDDQTEYPCSADAFRQVYANGGMLFLQRSTFGYSELQDLLIHQMVYNTYATLWNNAVVPAWFKEGLSSLYRLHPGVAALEVARDASRSDALFGLPVLASPLVDTADYRAHTLWESQSYLLALYLADRYGAEAPFILAQDTASSGGFDGALLALTGGDQQALWDTWNRWLFTDAAKQAVGWTPYRLTTPTPTATGTDTLVPPTATPSNTATNTLTPTSTFRGDQPPTAVVQRLTPTRLRTVTNTPLPPGSLPTARPRPSTGPGESGGRDTATMGGIIVLVAVATILIVSLVSITLRRRK